MNLKSHILTFSQSKAFKQVQSTYMHDCLFNLIPQSSRKTSEPDKVLSFLPSIMGNPFQDQENSVCTILYNISFNVLFIQHFLQSISLDWECRFCQFALRTGEKIFTKKFTDEKSFRSFFQSWKPIASSMYGIQIFIPQKQLKRQYYFLPSNQNGQTEVMESHHQMLKIVNYFKLYLSLQSMPDEVTIFESDLSQEILSFLYKDRTERVSFFMKCDPKHHADMRVLNHVSQLRVPQQWRDKKSYLSIKRQVFLIKCKQNALHQHLKTLYSQVTKTVNNLSKIAGFPSLKYSQITVQTLKLLKSQSFSEKVNRINECDQFLKSMDLRIEQLQQRKHELKKLKQNIQQQQVNQMLSLKNSIVCLQKDNHQDSGTKFFFKRDKPQLHQKLMTTIFSRAQKKKNPFSYSMVTNGSFLKSNRKSSVRIREEKQKKNEYKVDKKVAAVVKEDALCSSQLNFSKLREEFQMEQLSIDFEVEKNLQSKKQKYQLATKSLQKLIEGCDFGHFF